jgi:dihydrofolate reductase
MEQPAPVFVVSHHQREVLERKGGTSFTFVTEGGVVEAVARACAAAGDKDVHVSGGAKVVSQAVAAGLVDELHLHMAPVLLGQGMRLFDLDNAVELEIAGVVESTHATHIRYRVTPPTAAA